MNKVIIFLATENTEAVYYVCDNRQSSVSAMCHVVTRRYIP
jgi:hypothetical protein